MHGVTKKFNSKDLWDVNVHFALKGCRMGCDPGFCEHGFEPSGSIKAWKFLVPDAHQFSAWKILESRSTK